MKTSVHVGLPSPSPFPPHGRISSYVCSDLILLFICAERLTDVCLQISKSVCTSLTLLLAAFTRRSTPLRMGSNAVCLLLLPSRCREMNPYSSSELQCWEHALGEKPAHLIPLCLWSPSTQHNEGTSGPQAGKFLHEAHFWGPKAGRKDLEALELIDGHSASTDRAHLTS